MSVQRTRRMTEEEFMALPETTERMELVDGELIVAPSPTVRHQRLVAAVHRRLRAWAQSRSPRPSVDLAPVDIRFGSDRILQPDVFVHLDALPSDAPTPVHRVPDLVVEVLSGNRVYDRVAKRYLYGEAGVREYWTVEPGGEVDRHFGARLLRVESPTDRLVTDLLPGFSLDVRDLAEI